MSERRRKRFVPSLPLDLFSSAVVPPASPMPPPRAVPDAVWRATVRRRIWVGAVLAALWTGAIEARLVYLQVLAHDDLVARAERQQMRTITVPAKRGEILDRNGRVLAYSVDADSIYAVPTEIGDADGVARTLCAVLVDCDTEEEQVLADRFRRQRAFAYVRRQVSPDEAQRVAALGLDGIGFLKENRRYYPKRELAAHLLGYVGIDNTGLGGIESVYDTQIRGRSGTTLVQTDARHRAFSRVERPPTAGATLELTIDQYLQHIVERELRAGVAANKAAAGTAIVMDPHTGEILALANEPAFNPNAFARVPAAVRRNRAIQDIYEPGSTFKIVTASAALEEDVIGREDPVDVSAGMIRFGRRQIDDVHRYGVLSFNDVIVKSSNVGAIKVGLMLGPGRLGRYVRRFGFGELLSPDFRGQSRGIVWDPASLNDSALASVSMGYQIGVTPLQMVTAVSAVANGGELMEPRVVRAMVRDGSRVAQERKVLRRTITPETAAEMTAIMEDVVVRGTGKAAMVDGFTVAGKTGTAAKIVNGRYSKSEYYASFVGFVPSRDPVLAVLVVIDSPRAAGYYGGSVSAPIFGRIAAASLRHLGIVPTVGRRPAILRTAAADAIVPTPTATSGAARLTPAALPAVEGLVPDLFGVSGRDAAIALARAGLEPRVIGDGFVVEQEPPAGTIVEPGGVARVTLDRRRPAPAGAAP